ncbi:hypothetical protein MOF8_23855 [Methylobacterium oryzae]
MDSGDASRCRVLGAPRGRARRATALAILIALGSGPVQAQAQERPAPARAARPRRGAAARWRARRGRAGRGRDHLPLGCAPRVGSPVARPGPASVQDLSGRRARSGDGLRVRAAR